MTKTAELKLLIKVSSSTKEGKQEPIKVPTENPNMNWNVTVSTTV